MKNPLLIVLLLFTLSPYGFSQRKILIGTSMDVNKTDFSAPFKKFQAGVEINYFIFKKMTVSGGAEHWSSESSTFLTAGARLYPVKPLFLRIRGLIKDDFELSAGAGYDLELTKGVWGEFTSDYYFESQVFAIRAGVVFGF